MQKINGLSDLMAKVEKQENGCWLFMGHLDSRGYGCFSAEGFIRAHRYSYFKHNGPIPDGLHVLHKCDVRNCVNPEHLFLGTHADNMADMGKKGRTGVRIGEEHHKAKLTETQVVEIRKRYVPRKVTLKFLAEQYGVTHAMIGYIVRGANWKHIPNKRLIERALGVAQ